LDFGLGKKDEMKQKEILWWGHIFVLFQFFHLPPKNPWPGWRRKKVWNKILTVIIMMRV